MKFEVVLILIEGRRFQRADKMEVGVVSRGIVLETEPKK